jgi:hypothetical protein
MSRSTVEAVQADLLESFSQTWTAISDRLAGLGHEEYLWEPVPGCWTISNDETGIPRADWADPDPVPAPVTTIAWRMWHMAVDCLDSYSTRAFATNGTGLSGQVWVLEPEAAWQLLDAAWVNFREGFEQRPADALQGQLGPDWGPYAQDTLLALALHAQREIVHHGAEIALLRDLYARR